MSLITNLRDNLYVLRNNPGAIQRINGRFLRDVLQNKYDIVDPTNPFVMLMEATAVNVSAFMVANDVNTRRQYPAAAVTQDDLYLHMSDKDYIDRFGTPASTQYEILLNTKELIAAFDALQDDNPISERKLVLGRDSEFIVNGTTFTLQYPVEVRQLAHGEFQVVYDGSIPSPLLALRTNQIPFEFREDTVQKDVWITFKVDVIQVKIESYTAAITPATNFVADYTYTDSFCYCRVYNRYTSSDSSDNPWVEIKTTHTDQVYDPNDPTAVLRVLNGSMNVYIPQIYVNSLLVRGSLRVDIYTTKGEMTMFTEGYPLNAFSANFRNIDKSKDNAYTALVSSLNSVIVFSRTPVSGGTNAVAFEDLKTRVVKNVIGERNIPITNVGIETSLRNLGYTIVKNVDSVTNRVFKASKAMPAPFDEKLITAAASSIETLIGSISTLKNHTQIKNNDKRITLTPEIAYENVNSVIRILPETELQAMRDMENEALAKLVTNNKYLYTPFHYVLDTSSEEFEVRPYYLNSPSVVTTLFVAENSSTMLQAGTNTYTLSRSTTGYTLRVYTKSNAAYKALDDDRTHAQLSFVPESSGVRAYLNGTYIGRTDSDERIFEFFIGTNYDINSSDGLGLTNFRLQDTLEQLVYSTLVQDFDVIYIVSSSSATGWSLSSVDSFVSSQLIKNYPDTNDIDEVRGINQEKIRLSFGQALKTLWARSRSNASIDQYQTYTQDVPLFYTENIYKIDPVTHTIVSFDSDGEAVYELLHAIGDPVLDTDGSQIMKFKKGDIVRDSSGRPVVISQQDITRLTDLMFVEGAYFFATDSSSKTYRAQIESLVVQWLTNDLKDITKSLLDQTRIYFYPKTNTGTINARVDGNADVTLDAGQAFRVDITVPKTVFENTKLRESMKRSTIEIIDAALSQPTVTIDDIATKLKAKYGDDGIGVYVAGFGGSSNYQTLTVKSEGDRLSIRKRLTALANSDLIVEEDITVSFLEHDKSSAVV